jgi:hypothetical protein
MQFKEVVGELRNVLRDLQRKAKRQVLIRRMVELVAVVLLIPVWWVFLYIVTGELDKGLHPVEAVLMFLMLGTVAVVVTVAVVGAAHLFKGLLLVGGKNKCGCGKGRRFLEAREPGPGRGMSRACARCLSATLQSNGVKWQDMWESHERKADAALRLGLDRQREVQDHLLTDGYRQIASPFLDLVHESVRRILRVRMGLEVNAYELSERHLSSRLLPLGQLVPIVEWSSALSDSALERLERMRTALGVSNDDIYVYQAMRAVGDDEDVHMVPSGRPCSIGVVGRIPFPGIDGVFTYQVITSGPVAGHQSRPYWRARF